MTDYEKRAHALAALLTEQGFAVEEKHYPPAAWDEYDRHYVIAQLDGERVDVQYHQRFPEGSPPQGRNDAVKARVAQAQRQVSV